MFSKSKRFVDKDNGVPPVGSYDMKDTSSIISHKFPKSDRFTDPADSDFGGDISISSMDSVQSATFFRTPKPVLIKGKPKLSSQKRPQSYSASSVPKEEKKNTLFAELENLKELCARKGKENATLQKQLEAVYKDAETNLAVIKKEFSSTMMQLEEEKAELQKQVSRLSQDAVDHDLNSNGLQLQIKFYIDEISSTKQELATMKELLEYAEEKSAALEGVVKKIYKEMEASKQSLANLEELLSYERSNKAKTETDLNTKITSLQELNRKSMLEANLFKQQIHSLEEALVAEKFEHQKLSSTLEQERIKQICISRNLKEAEETTEIWRVKQQEAEEELALLQIQQNESKDGYNKMEKELLWTREELKASKEQISILQDEIKSAVSEADEKSSAVRQELSRRLVDTQKRLSAQEASFIKQKEDSLNTIANMQRDIDRFKDENIKLASESESWKAQMEDLLAKYQPFSDQLEAFDVLKSESSFARAEFLRVSADYAKLLGHQNPKQKIHYVSKLKDENVALKQENVKLKTLIAKQKKQRDFHSNDNMENSLVAANGKI